MRELVGSFARLLTVGVEYWIVNKKEIECLNWHRIELTQYCMAVVKAAVGCVMRVD